MVSSMTGKTVAIGVRVTPEIKDALLALAKERRWTLSQTAALMIEAGLKAERDTAPRP
jgi:hypothetical protein